MRKRASTHLLRRVLEAGDALPRTTRFLIVLLALVATVVADWYSGYEVAFASMYLLPIAAAAWFIGARPGSATALASTILWFAINYPVERGSTWLVTGWNVSVRLGMFLFVSAVVGTARELLDAERVRSHVDDLTGALNLRAFYETMTRELERTRRFAHPISIAYIDLDDFKEINDRFGHGAGDEILRGFARSIQATVRRIDTIARLGGDEFAVLMPETDSEGAIGAVTRMTDHLSAAGVPVSVSIGIVTCDHPVPSNIDAIIRRADALMYTAKRLGKNRHVHGRFSDPVANAEAQAIAADSG